MRFRSRRRAGIAIVALAGGLAGCRREGPAVSLVTERDSAGIRIVESSGARWGAGSGARRWSLSNEPSLTIGAADGAEEYLFSDPVGAGRIPDGRIFVADAGFHSVRLYSATGAFLASAGREGSGPGEFEWISGVGLGPADTLYAFDERARRISIISDEGRFVRFVTLRPRTRGRLTRAWWLSDGRFLASVWDRAAVWERTETAELGTLSYVLFDASGEETSVVRRAPGSEIVRVDTGQDRYATFQIPLFAYRPASSVASGLLYHGLSRSMEIGVSGLEGGLREVWRDLSFASALTEDEIRASARRAVARRVPDVDPDAFLASQPILSGTLRPPYSRMLVDSEGFLWVAEFVESDELPGRWTVFGPEGELMGAVEMPAGFELFAVYDGEVLGAQVDGLGVQRLRSLALTR